MNGENTGGELNRNEETYPDRSIDFRYTVSEGSLFVFDLGEFISEIDIHNTKSVSFLCEQLDGIPADNLRKETDRTFSFRAPYLRHSDGLNTVLYFKLTFKDNNTSSDKPISCHAKVIVKRVHRAIIFQGGVALGAYEAGVFQALIEKLIDRRKKGTDLESERRPLFDIVAGASIGAMNGAIVVSAVTSNKGKSLEDGKNWSAEEVIKFWRAQQQAPTAADIFDLNPLYHYWWDSLHNTSKVVKHSAIELIDFYSNMNPAYKWYVDMLTAWPLLEHSFWKDYFIDGWYIPATAEAVRRYYSAKHFRTTGPFNVATGVWPWLQFAKFFDFLDRTTSLTFRPDNKHFSLFSLKKTLERFSHFPIKTSPEEKEPRLLLVTVDVKTGDAVTFDSYNNEAKYHDNKNSISNKRGIEVEHALASGTFPDFFDYPKFKVNNAEKGIQNEEENIFWDGGFRSNTPLREVLQAHRDYWLSLARKKHQNEEDYEYENDVPDLEVYIADLWPSELKEGPISFDRDFVENRKWDLLFADKTHYDEQIANVVTDYIDLARRLKNLAERKGASKEEVDYILNSKASSINTIGKTRIYKELLEGRFRLTKVVRIDRKDDGNEVHNKVFDYSYKSIEDLMSVGYQDASIQMDLQQMKEGIMELIIINGHVSSSSSGIEKQQENHQIEKLEEGFRKIEESIKNENGYGYNTTKLVEDFMGQIELIEGLNENKTFLEEKASLIAAAKQLQNTINMIIKKQ